MDEWRQDWADRESIDRQTERERERERNSLFVCLFLQCNSKNGFVAKDDERFPFFFSKKKVFVCFMESNDHKHCIYFHLYCQKLI
jgi:hypothetical protein